MELRVLSYNIHKGRREYSRRLIMDELKSAIEETEADIVCLQEVQGAHSEISAPQFESLADRVWSHFAYAQNAVTQHGHHGNAILSRFPIVAHSNTNLALMKRASRSILRAEIEIPGQARPLQVMCVHMGLFGFERRMQVAALKTQIETMDPRDALIVAGDFNDWAGVGHRSLSGITGLAEISQHTNGKLARTFPARWPLLPVDRIYARHIEPVALTPLDGARWRGLSDHLPLVGRFRLPEY